MSSLDFNSHRISRVSAGKLTVVVLLVLILGSWQADLAQSKATRTKKLPSPEKIVDDYLKAIGGKKRIAQIRDATHDWTITLKGQELGLARTQYKAPGSFRADLTFGNGKIISGTNSSSAWVHGLDGQLHTLTGLEAATARLQALLDANHLAGFKKRNVFARTGVAWEDTTEPALVVEFSTRGGARLRYLFDPIEKLLIQIEDEIRKTTVRFRDYRAVRDSGNILEPHQVVLNFGGQGELTLQLQEVAYNRQLPDSVFDPPSATETLDVASLLREVGRNQEEVEKRVSEYAFVQTETDRELGGKGEVKKQTVKVYEVFPVANSEPIMKLVSENGVPLSAERAAKESKRVEEEFMKAERDRERNQEKADRRLAEQKRKNLAAGKSEDDDPELSQFLKVCEFVSPRRERFRDRDAVVFDFRPRPGFKPSNRQESLISKLVGVVWIDPVDKQVMRLEARLSESFKMAGGLLFSVRPGAALAMEQTRMTEGVWLPRLAQVNVSVKVLLFGGGDLNKTIEWSDYKHFKGDVGDYKLESPKTEVPDKKP